MHDIHLTLTVTGKNSVDQWMSKKSKLDIYMWTKTRNSATAEIARVSDRYAVQGHSRSPMLAPVESLYAISE